ncbi:hypothetical protein PHYBLDRAFT_148128 [Phycomyces blakesleeanus NRRL 1555(-)]|uniref:Uncharacterized protein n=1 Tax=Phycomyces blakesleeanus (strain ATCC 8743b / DSM 1359 / FGSC 10004 / NBRC 33097 / NRRL 1555) TaxID=763407 RepID=A0A167LQF7_PHYB8|nr:hypothetical protein PHYBLDRAFT_148128 [Phycomyces blakesleeanus NRRL 1555(-)]OAD70904.1 hypothetical protein PHYBLDRAFT_148128 [Phycomyces blakesleeanus NRRL 1555(-)]|eukprot:XP_018288944.1 hypothetical protein PHYBLDRAFT_148128 [Phycomyces blakesleeanus NRRL 1555(-)]
MVGLLPKHGGHPACYSSPCHRRILTRNLIAFTLIKRRFGDSGLTPSRAPCTMVLKLHLDTTSVCCHADIRTVLSKLTLRATPLR